MDKNKGTLYLSMIIKEDEPVDMVRRSINSVHEYVDEAYITVTYKDKKPTSSPLLELLKTYGAHVSFFHWINDFSAARQFAMDQAPKSPTTYIYWQDADDVLQHPEALATLLADAITYDIAAVFLNYWYSVALDENGKVKEVIIEHKRERLIRNDNTFTWKGMLHETLIEQRSENVKKIFRKEALVVHLTTRDRIDTALDRNITILEKQLELEEHKDPRTLVYLAKGYYDRGMEKSEEIVAWHDKALALFDEYLAGTGDVASDTYREGSGWREERATAWFFISEIYKIRGDIDVAINAISEAIEEAPEFPNYYVDKALLYAIKEDYKKAKQWLLLATSMDMPSTTIITTPRDMKLKALETDARISLHENNIKQLVEDLKMMLAIIPGDKDIMERITVASSLEAANRASQSVVYLGKYLEKIGETEKMELLLQAVPNDLRGEKFYSEMKHLYTQPRIWADNEIAILCGPGFEQWSPRSIQSGLGGSEEAVVYLSKELAKQGWKVTVYGNPGPEAGTYEGVSYKQWYDLDMRDVFNVLVLWRAVGFVDFNPRAKFKLLWMHDMPNNAEFTKERLDRIDAIAVLSEFHKEQFRMLQEDGTYTKIPDSKFYVTRNGIADMGQYTWKGNDKSMIYSSSPDRGLVYLLKNWATIKKRVPEATLDIYYGFDVFDALFKGNPGRMQWKQRVLEMMNQEGITYHGRVGHEELHEAMSKTAILAYPTDFTEISCHPRGTRITTERGEVEIEKVSIEDRVLTHTGTFQSVSKIMQRQHQGEMIEVATQSGDIVRLTPEHPLYVIKGKDSWTSFETIKDNSPEWIEAKDLRVNDCLLFPRYKSTQAEDFLIPMAYRQNNFNTIDNVLPKKIVPCAELSWWLGYFAGDGNASERSGKVSVLVADKHPEHVQPVLDGFRLFGVEVKSRQLRGCMEYYIQSNRLAKALRKYCYDEKKKMLPAQAMNEHGLAGLMAADGHKNNRSSTFTNTSLRLIGQVRQLLSEQGLSGRVSPRTHQNGNISYSVSWKSTPKQKFYGVSKDYIIKRVTDITSHQFNDNVFNLEVEQDNSYVANGHVVHNCITAQKAQALGAVPVVTDYAALKETVRNGLKVDVDIRTKEGQETYVDALCDLLQSPTTQEEYRKVMMPWAREYFAWRAVATQWGELFKTKSKQVIQKMVLTPEQFGTLVKRKELKTSKNAVSRT